MSLSRPVNYTMLTAPLLGNRTYPVRPILIYGTAAIELSFLLMVLLMAVFGLFKAIKNINESKVDQPIS
jgi:hypothetical protein